MKKYTIKQSNQKPVDLTIDYTKELNEEQLEVVKTGDGPCLVLAGAGSGKTRTLVYRVAWLLEHGVHPQNILLVTFTNKASREMLTRVGLLLKEDIKGLWGGTFHHIGNRILRKYATKLKYRNNFAILDQGDSEELIASAVQDLPMHRDKKLFPKARTIQSIISYSRNAQRSIKEVIEKQWRKFSEFTPHIEYIASVYEQKKQETNAMDYDDLLVLWLRLLRENPPIRDGLATQFQYILVDEFQDTNRIQANIMYELASVHNNILVVGDDAQSIYSFRAADVENILKFPQVFPDTKMYKLETNYRSVPEILELANASISHNMNSFDKELVSIRESQQNKPAVVPLSDSGIQAQFITQRIKEYHEEDKNLRDIAVLFRASHQTLELEVELTKNNIPYIKRGGLKYFEQAHIKDMVSFLKVVVNPLDEISWRRILKLYEGIGDKSAGAIWEAIRAQQGNFTKVFSEKIPGVSTKAKNNLERLNGILIQISELISNATEENHASELSAAITIILESGYKDILNEKFDDSDDRLEDLEQLSLFALNYPSIEQFLADIALSEGFRGEVRSKPDDEEGDDYLVLSTIHQAKGLEWKVVFVIGLVEGQFPNSRALAKGEDIEEERRLFYVAVTRAKDDVYLTYPISSFYGSQLGRTFGGPSRFVTELPMNSYDRWQIDINQYHDENVIDLEDL